MSIKLEIEYSFNVSDRGCFVIARRLDSQFNFYITKKSFLGDIELLEYLDIPRSIDENGNQRDIVALQLKHPEDAQKLTPGSIMELEPGNAIKYLEPWEPLSSHVEVFEEELRKELSEKHVLYNKQVRAVGRRVDNDDILFEVLNDDYQYAVVHLTWIQGVETNALYPGTQLFRDWLAVYNNRIVPDYESYL